MRKDLLAVLVLMCVFSAGQVTFAQQGLSFTIQIISIKNQPAYDMKVSPDGQIAAVYVGQIAASLLDIPVVEYVPNENLLPIRLIDLTTGNELGRLTGQTDYVSDVAFTPDGKQLASYHQNGEIYLWDVVSKQLIKRLTAIIGRGKLKFLQDGKTLVVDIGAGPIDSFFLWDMGTGYITKVWHAPYKSYGDIKYRALEMLNYTFKTFDISPDEQLLATATTNGEVALWDTATFQQVVVQKAPDTKGLVNVWRVMFSSDGKTLIYFDTITTQTHFWDVASRTETKAFSIGEQYFDLSLNNEILAWASRKELWFAKLDQPNLATKVLDFPDDLLIRAPTLTFTPDGKQLVVGGFSTNKASGDNVIYVVTFNQ